MKRQKSHKKKLSPKTKNQTEYIRSMAECHVILCIGPAGTGKTAVSVGMACQYLSENKVDKIVITRPVVEAGSGLGYLPGTFDEKIHPYLVPILEEMKLYLSKEAVQKLRHDGKIEVCPLEYMRGRNFHRSFMILDEAQNATREQIKMFITRMGGGSKAVVNGDIEQSDLPHRLSGGLEEFCDKLDGLDKVAVVELDDTDIIRNKLLSQILCRLDND
jgi:phosphate starvation-inducible PhoH-like protein